MIRAVGAVASVAGVVLLAHGLGQQLYLVDDVQEFSLERWWIREEGRPAVGLTLIAGTVVAFAPAARAVRQARGLAGGGGGEGPDAAAA